MNIGLLQNTNYENAEDANEEGFDFALGLDHEFGQCEHYGFRVETAGDELEPCEL